MALGSVGILLVTSHAVLLRDHLCRVAHVEIVVMVPQPIPDDPVDRLGVTQALALARFGQVVRSVRHRLHAASNRDLQVTGLDRLRGEHHGLETGATDLVDGDGRGAVGDAGEPQRLPRRVLPEPGLQHVAHQHFLDLLAGHAAARQRLAYDNATELRR